MYVCMYTCAFMFEHSVYNTVYRLLCLICLPLVLLVFKCIQVLQPVVLLFASYFGEGADLVNEAIALLSVRPTAIP